MIYIGFLVLELFDFSFLFSFFDYFPFYHFYQFLFYFILFFLILGIFPFSGIVLDHFLLIILLILF